VIGRFSNTFFVILLSTNHTALTSPVKWLLIYQKGNTRSSCGVTGKAVNCSKTTMNDFCDFRNYLEGFGVFGQETKKATGFI
jgi:hypothetical protein